MNTNQLEAAFISFNGKYWIVEGQNSGIVFADGVDTRAQAEQFAQEMQDAGEIAYWSVNE